DLGDAPFDRGVDVFVRRFEAERALLELPGYLVERVEDGVGFLVGEDAPAEKTPYVGARTGDVVAREPLVERHALRERQQLGGRPVFEASVPQRLPAAVVGLSHAS